MIWHVATRHLGWAGKLTQLTPLWDAASLGMLGNSKGFHNWDLIGLSHLGDLWRGGRVVSFKYLQDQYHMNVSEYYRYLQIKHAIDSAITPDTTLPASTPLEDRLLTDFLERKATSLTYKKIINNRLDPLGKLRTKWQLDVGDMEDPEWREALASPKEVSTTSKLRLVQLKILHRIYYTRIILHKIRKTPDPSCLRLCGEAGTFYHTIWTCPMITAYWTRILDIITAVCHKRLPPDPKCCLLNVWPPTDLNRSEQYWATVGFMVAKRNIAQKWGSSDTPTTGKWSTDMDLIMFAEKTTYVHRGCPKKWGRLWDNWNIYRGYICTPPDCMLDSDDDTSYIV